VASTQYPFSSFCQTGVSAFIALLICASVKTAPAPAVLCSSVKASAPALALLGATLRAPFGRPSAVHLVGINLELGSITAVVSVVHLVGINLELGSISAPGAIPGRYAALVL